ncbi:MAG TPA: CocE/NonD family hydrolase [Clostridia bacterium]|nr:CocE/NonD family hydrolase [Clostridia bacterium]
MAYAKDYGLMNLYCAGVKEGVVHFSKQGPLIGLMDAKSRFPGTPQPYTSSDFLVLPLADLCKKLPEMEAADWTGEEVALPCGDVYSRHIELAGTVDGAPKTAQLWAQRKADPAVDLITLDGAVIAFVQAHRYGMDVAVRAGHESLTPLAQYWDPELKLSQPAYGVDCLGIHTAVMRDGVRLAQRVFVPHGGAKGARWPTILVRSCYTKERMQFKLSKYVNKGYALVMQDVRGRGDSEGELDPFAYERDDTSDTIDWIIAQPWSDGKVGTWGASYLGHVVVQGATSGHPNLKCVIDEVNVGSPFIDTVRRGGALCSEPLLCWAMAQSSGLRPDMKYMSGEVDWEPITSYRPIRDIVKHALGEPANDLWEKWTRYDEENEWWQRCDFSRNFHRVKAPMLVISGWYDGDGLGVSETWRGLTRCDVPERRIILGPWAHGPNTTRDVEGVAAGNNAIVYNFDITNLRWFDHYLKGVDNGVDRGPRAAYYVVGENQWHESADWPPAESAVTPCYLDSQGHANSVNGDGALCWEAPAAENHDTYLYDPELPHDDLISEQVGHRSPINYKGHELRADMLVYTSEPLARAVTIAGEISASFYAASSARDTDWVLRLLDVDPDGNARKLSENVIRAKFRNGFSSIELLTPGKVEAYSLQMESNGWRVEKGHRLRVHVQSSAKHLVFPNTNTGNPPFDETDSIPARNSLYHGGTYPSHIKLPILKI